MKIQVQNRPSYGKDRIYPMCQVSEFIAGYGNRKTFEVKDIDALKAFGFEVEYLPLEQPNPTTDAPTPKQHPIKGE